MAAVRVEEGAASIDEKRLFSQQPLQALSGPPVVRQRLFGAAAVFQKPAPFTLGLGQRQGGACVLGAGADRILQYSFGIAVGPVRLRSPAPASYGETRLILPPRPV